MEEVIVPDVGCVIKASFEESVEGFRFVEHTEGGGSLSLQQELLKGGHCGRRVF